ncbi:acetoin reductase family protein [Crassisporium funariophilum]|nr:acetoin reductase family protein [Crassisporium funariophilum]
MKGTALITGASRGIGRSIACRLAKDGFQIALNDIPSQKGQLEEVQALISKTGGKAEIYLADVSVEADVEGMVNNVVESMGSLDVMVANAGICINSLFVDTTLEQFQRIFSVNVIGVFLCYKHAARQMIKQGRGGRIIGASSVAGKQGLPMLTAYSTSKFAVRGLTQNLAVEVGQYGITVNAYAPGAVDTMMLQRIRDEIAARKVSVPVGDVQPNTGQNTPLGFDGVPDDIASLVSYLASEESRFMTGQSVSINGGMFFD